MPRETFEAEIQRVKDDVLVLGSMVEQALLDSVEALKKRDIKAAEKVFTEDKAINKKRSGVLQVPVYWQAKDYFNRHHSVFTRRFNACLH